MRRLISGALVALLLLPALAATGTSASTPATTALRIAVVDTGIDATHPEFAAGQVVAWRDFTSEASPTPKDGHGHGTATASLVAGLNAGRCGDANRNNDKLSFAPGASLIIARVGTNSGAIEGSTDAAIRWAVDQGADVVSMSIGSIAPVPLAGNAAIQYARDNGVLVVVSAGNGAGNLGAAPYPAWTSFYGNDANALAIGAGTRSGTTLTSLTGNLDPDISSWGDSVCVALANKGTYGKMSGTSFAAPLVAGMAGKAMEIARENGKSDDDERIERILLLSAKNTVNSPYAREGMGWLLDGEWPTVAAHAAAGTLPDYDAQGDHARYDRIYHDNVVETARRTQGIL